jgi:hypothetical protein
VTDRLTISHIEQTPLVVPLGRHDDPSFIELYRADR